MAEEIKYLKQTHHSNIAFQSSFHTLDPLSLLLHQNSASDQPVSLKLTTESFFMERGPRYNAYAELRESKLRMKNARFRDVEETEKATPPPKKQVKFQGSANNAEVVRKRSSVVGQSVPDFSAVLRKENRKPAAGLSPVMEMTPPSKMWSKIGGGMSNSRGSKSASAGEKKGGLMARKSYASFEELKGFSSAASFAINGENRRGGRRGRTVLGTRQI